jgi:hypothetical protein
LKKAIMVMFEPFEWIQVIEGLLLFRENKLAACGVDESEWDTPGTDHETEGIMWRILLHAGLPDAKRSVPEAYALCFPEGPPRIVGTYGKHNK